MKMGMAFCSNIVSVAFIAFCCILSPSKADLIDDVCSNTNLDIGFCKSALRSDPRLAGADLSTLAQIAIDSAQSYTKSAIFLVQDFLQSATDPEPKEDYESCLRNYHISSNELVNCVIALKDGDYGTLKKSSQAAYDASSVCDSGFREPQAREPRSLSEYGVQVQTLCSAITYMADKLGL